MSFVRPFRLVICSLLTLLTLAAISTEAFGHEGWYTDMDAAMKAATEERKDIFVDFSGSDWCHWCRVLDKEIFKDPSFEEAKEKFVLVSLDFPQDQSLLTAAQKKHNEEWRNKFEVAGFPMIFLLDAKGRPFARTGYKEGGPQKYLQHLDELIDIRKKRDAAFVLAKSTQGEERAKHLHAAMQELEPGIAWLGYDRIIREIARLDADDKLGLKTLYGQGMQRRVIGKELATIMANYEPSKAKSVVRKLRALEAKVKPTGQVQNDLKGMMAQLLVESGEQAEAIKLADEVLADESTSELARLSWGVLKTKALASSKDFDGALTLVDELLKSDSIDGDKAGALIGLRCQVLVGAGREQDAFETLEAFLPKAQAGEVKQQLEQMRDGIEARIKDQAARKEEAAAK